MKFTSEIVTKAWELFKYYKRTWDPKTWGECLKLVMREEKRKIFMAEKAKKAETFQVKMEVPAYWNEIKKRPNASFWA